MPESGPTEAPEGARAGEGRLPEEELQALETTVDRLLGRLETLRRRAREAEEAHGELRRALSRSQDGADGDEDAPVEERLRRLSHENERLREILDEGREKAERIRQRLVLLEDES